MMQFHHILSAVLVAAIWGFNFIAVKVGLSEMPPFLYSAARMALVTLPLIFFVKKPAISWSLIVSIGMSLGVVKFGLLVLGIHVGMPVGLASLVLQSQVFFTVALSVLFLGEKVQMNQWFGMFLAFIGITLIGMNLHEGSSTLAGFLLVLASAFSWGVCNILTKKAGNVDMFALVIWTSLIPPLPLYTLSYYIEGPQALPHMLAHMTALGWTCLFFTACGASCVGYTLWGILLRTYETSMVAPFALLVPVFGISFSHIFLDEQFTTLTYSACGLVFLGLITHQWHTRKNPTHLAIPSNEGIILDKVA
jgi:O-acetylserine/cysteine efflux transporter